MAQSILIPSCVAEKVLKRLARLASDAGVSLETVPGTSVVYRKAAVQKWDRHNARSYMVHQLDTTQALECVRVTIGDMPRCNGFEFIGKITHTEAGNLVCMAGDAQNESTPEEWRTAKPTCDHCNTQRRRNDTFLIRCPDGLIKRIGRNCLADFLMTDPSRLVATAAFEDMLRSLDEESESEGFGGFGGLSWSIPTDHYLACAVASVDRYGFFKSDSEHRSTRADAHFLADNGNASRGDADSRQSWKEGQPTAEHFARAVDVALWLESSDDKSDYISNLKVALSLPVVRRETEGLIASAPQAYARHLGQIAERAARPADGGHLGAVGQRVDTVATILRVSAYESHYGTSAVIAMRTADGQDLVTFTSSDQVGNNDVGTTYKVRGTVKKHEERNGRAQTVLSRCVFKAVAA